MRLKGLILAAVLLIPFSASADTEIFGRVKAEAAYESAGDKFQKNEQSMDLEVKKNISDSVSVKAIIRALHESELEEDELSRVDLREFYLDISRDSYKLRLGRQQVVWGKTDGLRLLDLINPSDYREFIFDDFIDSRIPLWMARGDFYVGDDTLQFLLIPDVRPNLWAEKGSRFDFLSGAPRGEEDAPDLSLSNSEAGVRYSGFAGGWDYTLNYFNSWEDRYFFSATGPILRYYKTNMFGGSFSKAFGSFVFRGELAMTDGKKFYSATASTPDNLVEKSEVKGALGLDYTVGDWLISGQVFENRIIDFKDSMLETQNISLLIDGKFLNETLDVKLMSIYGVNKADSMLRLSATYSITDRWKVLAGFSELSGPDDSYLGRFKDADRSEMEVTYSF